MREFFTARIRGLGLGALVVLALSAQPALAQREPNRDPNYVTASQATDLARYYAPYALQAAAAYVDVSRFDDVMRGSNGQPRLDGADVALAVGSTVTDPTTAERATKYLRAWRYQFGSEGYLDCYDKSDAACQATLQGADRRTLSISGGPTFQVWARTGFPQRANAACREVSIAFRGTTGSLSDWLSNLRPLLIGRYVDDEYRQLRRNIDAILRKITTLRCYTRGTQIVSVGHSLGGGLAQLAGLANNPNPGAPRIVKVFAFDPSPLTGYRLVDGQVLAVNEKILEIDRVYQSGEVLQQLRRYVQQYPRSSPCVRTVVFDALQPTGRVKLHNMAGLAGGIVQLSYDRNRIQRSFFTPDPTACPSQYAPPASDEDEPFAPNLVPVSARRAPSFASFARSSRERFANDHIRASALATAFPQGADVDSVAARFVQHRTFKSAATALIHRKKSAAKVRTPMEQIGTGAALL